MQSKDRKYPNKRRSRNPSGSHQPAALPKTSAPANLPKSRAIQSSAQSLLRAAADSSAIRAWTEAVLERNGRKPIIVVANSAAQSLLLAYLVSQQASVGRVWAVVPDARALDVLATNYETWGADAIIFQDIEAVATDGAFLDPEVEAERLDALQRLASGPSNAPVITTLAALGRPVPNSQAIKASKMRLARSTSHDMDTIIARLTEAGFERVTQVAHRQQFAVRGGILDVFPLQQPEPVRIEFDGEVIESIRFFDIHQQTTTSTTDVCELMLTAPEPSRPLWESFHSKGDLLVAIDCETSLPECSAHIASTQNAPGAALAISEPDIGHFDAGDLILDTAARERLIGQLVAWRKSGWSVVFVCNNEGEIDRLRDFLHGADVHTDGFEFLTGSLGESFVIPDAKLAALSDASLFGRYRQTAGRRRQLRRAAMQAARAPVDFSDIEEGETVVHVEHGIAIYNGLSRIADAQGIERDALELEFAESAKLYVPIEHAYLVGRYVGVGKKSPKLSKLGDGRWQKARRAAEKAVFDYAAHLLELHAERESAQGHAFQPDTRWQEEFEQAFLFKETPDQLQAIADAKADMESPRPMDRLICGDVGFGKTEVAIRAAFKAVMDGMQVAMLVPTTVLAQQHVRTLRERMSDYPIVISEMSRFVPPAEQTRTIKGLAEGAVDIVVGTHRLLSSDVVFKSLGLLVVDEEQRFGVLHKEKLKERFRLVDVLTLSATPIPRTLYLSLMGARDMSVIETPPANRLPVETVICPYDERVIRDAINRELARGGQVFFLHNRVGTISHMRERIAHLCPQARIDIGHGQMPEDELEEVMHRFVDGQTDVLLSTTIIESGLDIPNANTILIDRADRFGLADLYQLRGRVGRAQAKAFAYFLLPRDMVTRATASKRIAAIRQYSDLGAGFRVAMRDLEIRGAGNLLGTAQSGHIVAVGFDLYCQLLKQAVARLRGEKPAFRAEAILDLDFTITNEAAWEALNDRSRCAPAFLPAAMLPDADVRIQCYRELAEATSQHETATLRKAWRDRFGPLPPAIDNLLVCADIRIAAATRKITKVQTNECKLMLTRNGSLLMPDGRFPRLTASDPNSNLRFILDLIHQL